MLGTQVWSLLQEDTTRLGATKPGHPDYWARPSSRACEPQLMSPCAAATKALMPAACPPKQEETLQWEAPRWRLDPHSPQLEKASVQQQRPSATKNKLFSKVHLLSEKVILVVVQSLSRVRLCDPMDCSTPGFPVLHHLLELAQTLAHWVRDAIQSSVLCRPLLLLPSIFPSIRVFSNKSTLRIRWPKYWSFSFSMSPSNEYSGLISFKIDWLDHIS